MPVDSTVASSGARTPHPPAPPDVLYVTKPLAPPWDDSGKLLPSLLARHIEGVRVAVLTPRGHVLGIPGVVEHPLYRGPASFTVPAVDKARLFAWLVRADLPPVVHFFFSPNRATATAARLFRRLRPHVRVVQTVMSLPEDPATLASGLFADLIVVWSARAHDLVTQAVRRRGLAARVAHVPPGIIPLAPATPAERRRLRVDLGLPPDLPVVLYAGDLEFSSAAGVVGGAVEPTLARVDAVFVFACRDKTPRARSVLAGLQEALAARAARGQVRFVGSTPRFHGLLRSSDVLVLPAETTHAKTDLPLVVLEALSAGVPAVVGSGTPMQELVDAGAALGVPPLDPDALAGTLAGLLSGAGRAAAFGRAGRAFVLGRHTAKAMADAHATLYRTLLREAGYPCAGGEARPG